MLISEILDRAAITPRVSAPNKRQALAVIADIAARNFGLDSDQVVEALMEREHAGSTGVGHGVAVPHGIFLRLEHPIEFGAVDDQPVDLIFALLSPVECGAEHLRSLARVSRVLRQGDLREQLRQARTADAIQILLAQEARPTAA
jgi:PTS system nitrogen regulatory IIA component